MHDNSRTFPCIVQPKDEQRWNAAWEVLHGKPKCKLGVARVVSNICKNSPQKEVDAVHTILSMLAPHVTDAMRESAVPYAIWPTDTGYIQQHPDTHRDKEAEACHGLGHVLFPCSRFPTRYWRKGGLRAQVVRLRPLRGPPHVFVDLLVHANGAYMLSPELGEMCSHEILWSGDVMDDLVTVYAFEEGTDVMALFQSERSAGGAPPPAA